MEQPINNLEQIVTTTKTDKKSNESKFFVKESGTSSALIILRVFWLVSFLSWIIFTFFTKGQTSSIGMWTSLSFMWVFLLLHHLSKYK